MARQENDSMFFDFNGQKEVLRLDLVPANIPVDPDMVVTAVQVTDTEDDSTDLAQGHFRVNLRQDDGSYKELRGEEFTYALQRELQPQLEEHCKAVTGPGPCMTHSEFKYAHIPLHQSRRLRGENLTDLQQRRK